MIGDAMLRSTDEIVPRFRCALSYDSAGCNVINEISGGQTKSHW